MQSFEELIPLSSVAKLLPTRADGRRIHTATIWRWATSGSGGRRLRTVRLGRTHFTSSEWVREFLDFKPEVPPPVAPAAPRVNTAGIEAAEAYLRSR